MDLAPIDDPRHQSALFGTSPDLDRFDDRFTDRPSRSSRPDPKRSGPRFAVEPLADIEPVLNGEWLIKDLLPATGLGVIYGAPGCGKSFLALDVALHVAAGRTWAGKTTKQAGVIYIASEGSSGFRKRVVAACRHHGIPKTTPFGLISTPPNLGTGTRDADDLITSVRDQADALGFTPALIILDTLARSMDGADENSPRDMGVFVSNAERIGQELGALVVAVHHSGKDADKGMRGSSALHGASAIEWEVSSDDAGRSARVAKNKDGEAGMFFMFQMFRVEVGRDDDGDPVTTMITEVGSEVKHDEAGETSKNKTRRITGQRAEFMKAVRMAVDDVGAIPPACSNIPAGQKCATRQQVERYAEQLGFLSGLSATSRRPTLDRHIRTLAGDGLLGQWGAYLWPAETKKQAETL